MPVSRTSINLDEKILRKTKKLAQKKNLTMRAVIEEALVEYINRDFQPSKTKFELKLEVVKGKALSGIDIDDRDSLYEKMEKDKR